jgi:pyrroline-5-carboxylate reductase
MLDPVTALSGSGPAYFFLLIETMIRTGIELGLEPAAATLLAEETAIGAARMALESEDDVGELRRRVTSPGGTTAAAVEAMEEAGVPAGIANGIRAASARSAALARDFGSD